uniref:Uncharacterized protein n=1 Tax=Brassica oleracea TaxID=3712 RepID=A0A3P6DQM0_BRAOL|nr:unnamed protein product [Brassica oleracea]
MSFSCPLTVMMMMVVSAREKRIEALCLDQQHQLLIRSGLPCHLLQFWTSTSYYSKVVIILISVPTPMIYFSNLPIPLFLFIISNLCFPLNFI